jgi:hypothetical protein
MTWFASNEAAGFMRFAMIYITLCETALHIEGLILLQHVVTGTRELVGDVPESVERLV